MHSCCLKNARRRPKSAAEYCQGSGGLRTTQVSHRQSFLFFRQGSNPSPPVFHWRCRSTHCRAHNFQPMANFLSLDVNLHEYEQEQGFTLQAKFGSTLLRSQPPFRGSAPLARAVVASGPHAPVDERTACCRSGWHGRPAWCSALGRARQGTPCPLLVPRRAPSQRM